MPKGELEQLRQRRKELLLESDINRQILRVEFCQLKLKATDWKRGLFKARTAYHWVAPLAGIGFAIYGMRKKMHATTSHSKGNGRYVRKPRGKAAYMNLLAPLGAAALRQGFKFWRHARKERK
jgi:hypothetical protein